MEKKRFKRNGKETLTAFLVTLSIYIYIHVYIYISCIISSIHNIVCKLYIYIYILSVTRNAVSVSFPFLLNRFFSISIAFLPRFFTVSVSFLSPAFLFRFHRFFSVSFAFLFRFSSYFSRGMREEGAGRGQGGRRISIRTQG